MKVNKCPSCGASSTTTTSDGKIVCTYCHTIYHDENRNESIHEYNEDHAYLHGDRPTINILLAFILFVINWILGLVYILVINSRQKEWDKYHNNK